jgi:hypothetical protein
MGQTVRFQETLRRLSMIDAPVVGLGRVVCAAPDVATALGYDVAAALEETDGYWQLSRGRQA